MIYVQLTERRVNQIAFIDKETAAIFRDLHNF